MPRARKGSLLALPIAASPAAIADLAGIRAAEIYQYIREGLAVYRVGMRRRIFTSDFEAFCKQRWKDESHGTPTDKR
jgi:hypothetical protein